MPICVMLASEGFATGGKEFGLEAEQTMSIAENIPHIADK
jgi:hypothetical protein